jgi:hypothetical protein
VALLVYPDYSGAAGTIEEELCSASLLAPPFQQLDVPRHISSLRSMLRDQEFFVRSMDMRVRSCDLKLALRQAISMQPAVLMLVFCGHGSEDRRQAVGHGVLRLSGGDTLDTLGLSKLLKDFRGTLIQLLNMCNASPHQPAPVNASLKPDKDRNASWGCQGQERVPVASHKLVSFFSCCSDEGQPTKHADAVLDAFVAAAAACTPYSTVRADWPAGWELRQTLLRPIVYMAADYSGVFPGPASSNPTP